MPEQSNHIISRLRWETSFDQREKAAELQQRLGSWGRLSMQREITAVFDALCPPGQTWRIQSLEIDLGTIDFDHLESDLSLRFGRQLKEELAALLLHSDQRSNAEMISDELSELEALGHFLVTGIMPWYGKTGVKSVNDILAFHLQKDRKTTIDLLKKAAPTHENVRKRMAWQLQEANIIQIIEGVEPTNHEQIVTFSAAMSKIQQHKNIVRDNSGDFRKNLWLWIFNYLFTDRGSVFNQAAFMKSSIQQMANHYNVAYHTLVEMIEQALAQASVNSRVKADFILMLQLLATENHSNAEKIAVQKQNPALALQHYLEQLSNRNNSAKKTEINEWIIALSNQDRAELNRIITASETKWFTLLKDLDHTAVASILQSLSPQNSDAVAASIRFIYDLVQQTDLKMAQADLWEMALAFVWSHKNSPFDAAAFLQFIVQEISDKKNSSTEKILNQLLTATVSAKAKNGTNVEIYAELLMSFGNEISRQTPADYTTNFHQLLDDLFREMTANRNKKVQNSATLIGRYFVSNPTRALGALIEFEDKKRLQHLLPHLVNEWQAETLMRKSNSRSAALLLQIQQIAATFDDPILNANLQHLWAIGLNSMVLHPELSAAQFLRVILERLQQQVGRSKPIFALFLEAVLNAQELKNGISGNHLSQIKTELGKNIEAKPVIIPIALGIPMNVAAEKNKFSPFHFQPKKSQTIVATTGSDFKITVEMLCGWIEKALKNEHESLLQNGKTYRLADLIKLAVGNCPDAFRNILRALPMTQKRIQLLQATDWNICCLWIAADDRGLQHTLETLRSLYHFTAHFSSGNNRSVEAVFWKKLWQIIAKKTNPKTQLQQFIRERLDHLFQTESLNSATILKAIQSHKLWISPELKHILMTYNNSFATISTGTKMAIGNDLVHLKLADRESLFRHLLLHKQLPEWYENGPNLTARDVFEQLIALHPLAFIRAFQKSLTGFQKPTLSYWIDLKQWVKIMRHYKGGRQSVLVDFERLHAAFKQVPIGGISSAELHEILLRKLVTDWANDTWDHHAETTWRYLMWEICGERNVPKVVFSEAVAKIKYALPLSVRMAYESTLKDDSKTQMKRIIPTVAKQLQAKNPGGIPVKNAGIVLLSNYIPMLFERLGIVRENEFPDALSQLDAVHYLQYVATGLRHTEEALLPLNKVLCGLPLAAPVMESIEISDENQALINGLIEAAISHWPSVGDTSVDGFRGNWLVRDGLLLEKDDRWELTVEKRSYDLLIHKSPFSISIIKHPWMDKPLHVIWPY